MELDPAAFLDASTSFDLSFEQTPRLEPEANNQLVRIMDDPRPCYLCAKITDYIMTFPGHAPRIKYAVRRPYRAHVCYRCAVAQKLWAPPSN